MLGCGTLSAWALARNAQPKDRPVDTTGRVR
jgi:hypothetical protein